MPDSDGLQKSFIGERYTVTHCTGAIESLEKALGHCRKDKAKSLKRGLILQIIRLANGYEMSTENFPPEGNLPKRHNQTKADKFYAFKRVPIRGYCWKSVAFPGTYFISHYVYKDYKKLKESDEDIVRRNWKRIEVDGDEC